MIESLLGSRFYREAYFFYPIHFNPYNLRKIQRKLEKNVDQKYVGRVVLVILLMVENLMIRKGLEDKRCNRLVIFNLLVSYSLCIPHRIGTMVHELVEPVVI